MYKMSDGWTDERMDDFRDEVYRRFGDVDKRFDKFEADVDRRFGEVDKRFDKVDWRFDKVDRELGRLNDRFVGFYRAQFIVGGGIIAALIGVIATQI